MRRTTGEIGAACPFPPPLLGMGDWTPGASWALGTGDWGPSSTCASPGRAPPSMRARTTPTSTVWPSSTRISTSRPLDGAGISVSTLSVEISTIGSSVSIQSPTRLRQATIVPSATDTPIWGIVTSTAVGLVGEELTAGLPHVVRLRQHRALERRAERDRGVGCGHAHHRTVEVLERLLRDQGADLGADATGARGLVQHHDLARLAHRLEDRVAVERHQRAQVDHLDGRPLEVLGGLERDAHHRAVRDHG